MTRYHHYTGHTTQTYRKLYGYKNLLAWQAADELAASVHRLVVRFPQRYYKLANQMLGSASSAKANIAEGYCRNAIGDYIRFCEIARGSLGELGSQIQDCERWELIKADDLKPLLKHFSDATYFLEGLIKSLRTKRKEGTWDRSLGVKEETGEYLTPDAEIPLMLPDEFPERNAEDQDETQEN
jgi:four helix bundle protein